VFDVRRGAVVLEDGVYVQSGTRLEGPLFVGPGTLLLGGEIRQSAIGPHCRVHGEVAASVFLGYANKSHDGFVGHSVLGQWVNLGAGTITSNLKNTYGQIRLDAPGGRLETGRTNLGSLFGDHAKTAIGSMLATGSVVGAGANVFGQPIPRWVPPFAWGAGGRERLEAEGFITIARRVMPRRRVEVSPEIEASLRAIYRRLGA
jgi:UDP-N-acetylglucosamine diphosphorylase/glucosamine-1-phosphate N-acetyltransferase